jgi:asparagine synthase (glutamine-hydrolysing)
MCGIAGIILKKGPYEPLQDMLIHMTNQIHHRGPDGEGVYYEKNVGLGHRRLAIIDRSTMGHQPMFYQDGQLVITYNGEIYNYIELRQELSQKGYRFDSHTDTEVILAAYAEWGEGCVNHFNGMWAFAILDKTRKRIFCARDRFGVKPFYYVEAQEVFAFGSEIRQLLPFLTNIHANQTVLVDFILTGIADHSHATFFKDVVKLQPGHFLIYSLETHHIQIQSYYQIQPNLAMSAMNEEEAVSCFMQLLEDAVQLRLRADVAVGTCLSGGLDSSSVASLAAPLYQAQAGRRFCGITAVSEQESNNEAAYAKQVIDHAGMEWIIVCPTYDDFKTSLPDVVTTQEEPFGSPSITMQYFVMKTARAHGIPVLLDGQGGDETLLGYEKYYGSHLASTYQQQGALAFIDTLRTAGKNNRKLSVLSALKYLIAGSMAPLRYRYYRQRHRYLSAFPIIPNHLKAYSRAILNSFTLQRLEIEHTNLPILLRYEDKNSMAHSIETRLPFLDYRVLEAALSLPAKYKIKEGWTKWLLRKGMEHKMPDTITWRKNKFGFEAPEALWLKAHQDEMRRCVLGSALLKKISKQSALDKQFSTLDYRSQWRLYSIALWETQFGVTGFG